MNHHRQLKRTLEVDGITLWMRASWLRRDNRFLIDVLNLDMTVDGQSAQLEHVRLDPSLHPTAQRISDDGEREFFGVFVDDQDAALVEANRYDAVALFAATCWKAMPGQCRRQATAPPPHPAARTRRMPRIGQR